MKLHSKRALAGLSALTIAGGMALVGAGNALAVTPGWEPDPGSIGSVTLTDANGVPITGGTGSPLAPFEIGSKAANPATDTKATLFYYLPVQGVLPANWNGEQPGTTTTYSPAPAAIPPILANTHLPVNIGHSGDLDGSDMVSDFPNTSTDPGYQNLYQLRLVTSDASHYDTADITVDPSSGAWTLVPYPAATSATTTALSASPPSPDVTAVDPAPVTLTTTLTHGAVPSTYTGPLGTVQIKDGATIVDTELVPNGATSPYVVTTNLLIPNPHPSDHSYVATFSPYNGTSLIGSASAALPYHVGAPLPTATTTLNAVWQGSAGGSTPTQFSGTVTGNGATPPDVTVGHVNLYDNGSATPLNGSTPLTVGAGGAFSFNFIFTTAITHSVVATFTDPGVYQDSSSAPVSQSLGNPSGTLCTAPGGPVTGTTGSCDDKQYITGTVPVGQLTVSTPYFDQAHALNVGTLALDTTGQFLTTSAAFGGAGLDPTNANADIIVTDTRAGDHDWTLQAQSSNLQDAASDVINGQNVGLTGLGSHPAPGFNTAGLVGFDNPAAHGVAPLDPGSLGLGGSVHHDVAQATGGIGTVGIYGTLTLNAPTSTPAGTYNGTVTFTIVGALVPSA